ncbi:MAG: hypothetical protein ABW328_00360 [Ilumatobacteraceae bacterium]
MTARAMRPIARRLATPLLASLVVVTSAACSTTTINSAATTVPADDVVPTTVFAPSGTTAELLAQLSGETGRLSALVVDGDGQEDALVRIEALWALIRPAIDTERPELISGFDTVIDLIRRSVERRRPADADKAAKNLTVLIAAYGS